MPSGRAVKRYRKIFKALAQERLTKGYCNFAAFINQSRWTVRLRAAWLIMWKRFK